MPPKKKVTFNLNHVPGRPRRTRPPGHIPIPPPLPPLPRRNRAASIRNVRASLQGIAPPPPPPPPLPRRNRGRNVVPPPPRQNRAASIRNVRASLQAIAPPPPPPPPPPRPPRSRPLRRYTGMSNLTKIPKQKGGAFTREMGKKLFLDRLTRPSRPSVTRTSKPRKKPKKHRDTKDVANKRMQQFQKLRNLAHPPMRAAKVCAKKKLKEHRALRNLAKIDRARKLQRGDWKRVRNLDMEPTATKVVKKRVTKKKPKRQAKVVAKKRLAQLQKLQALAGHPSKPKKERSTQWKRLRQLDITPRPNESAEDAMKRQLLQAARQEISHLSTQKIKALSGPTRVAKNKNFLDALQQVEEKHRKKLIKGATTEQINTISEVALNILQGNVPLKEHHKKKLNKHKKSLRALASKGVSVQKRKKIINQHGGMIGAAASALGEYTYDNIKKYNADYNSFCTEYKEKHKIPCKYAPKDYNTDAYRKKHNDNVKCTIL